MRCRSDPVKIEALTTGSWEPSVARNEEEDEEFVDCENQIENVQQDEAYHDQDGANQDQKLDNVQKDELKNVQEDEVGQDQELKNVQDYEVGQDQEHDNVQGDEVGQDQEHDNEQEHEVGQDQELDNVQEYEVGQDQEQDNDQQYEVQDQELDNEQKDEVGQDQEQIELEEESFNLVLLFENIMNQDYEIQEQDEAHEDVAEIGATMVTELAEISETHEEETVNEAEVLPECLLLMIHEPKLSINVSKETWVCRTDFIKRPSTRKPPPPPPPIKPDGGVPTVLQQPARSSCSLPMATVLEQKLANAVGYEPFVLTRCKSEPMKTAASKLLPESCVWENRKLERLSRAGFGVGAAGLGF
ncbi:hypothetical protein L1987_31653 [Smallanthus sonchifolius]|uniref:Uncharacterized protein n=1 Tax=Smallanthus sonchifolius TaxID=185202 RepID=A0ACB9I7Q6_9ASTR|nr:hypothetical protein L1987_31653 [Smallanthus sonchifolius]